MAEDNVGLKALFSFIALVVGIIAITLVFSIGYTINSQEYKTQCNSIEGGEYFEGVCYTNASHTTELQSDALDAIVQGNNNLSITQGFVPIVIVVAVFVILFGLIMGIVMYARRQQL